MYLVSWFTDNSQPKWENMVLVTFYPQGLSYFRPFRYRHKWISKEVLEELGESYTKIITASRVDTLLCAKFSTTESIIPIRRIELTHIQASGDEYYIYFKVGPLVDYAKCTSILEYSTKLTESITGDDRQKLFHKSAYDINNIRFVRQQDPEAESQSWTKFLDLLCLDKTLPLEKVKRSIFLRLSSLIDRDTGAIVVPSKVATSHRKGEVYGYALQEGKYYEAELLHRVPLLIDTQLRLELFNYKISSSSDYLQLSPDDLEISGNYESHVIQLYAKESSPEGQTLHFAGPADRAAKYDGNILNLHNFQIYFKNTFSFKKLFRKRIAPFLVIFAILFLALTIPGYLERGREVFNSPQIIGQIILIIVVAAIGGAVTWKKH